MRRCEMEVEIESDLSGGSLDKNAALFVIEVVALLEDDFLPGFGLGGSTHFLEVDGVHLPLMLFACVDDVDGDDEFFSSDNSRLFTGGNAEVGIVGIIIN